MKTQINVSPWEVLKGEVHKEKRHTMWDSFLECLMLDPVEVFRHDAREALKYYIMNTLKNPMRVLIRHILSK